MKQFYLVAMALLCFVPTLHAQRVRTAQVLGNQPAAVKPSNETIVYPVRTGPASELAASLKELYPNTPIVVALDVNSVLLIRVDADSKDEILGTLTKLDRPYRTIVVHAYLLRSHGVPLSADETAGLSGPRDEVLKRIDVLRKGDQLSIENRIELTTIENQKAMVQVGQQLPIVSGSAITSSRTRVNNYERIETGTIFTVQARTATGDAIVMEINFEKSEVDPPVAPSDDTASLPPGSVSTLVHQSTVQFADGDAVLAGTMVGKPTAGSGHSYLVVTANVRDGAAEQPKAAGGPASGSNAGAATRSPQVTRTRNGSRPTSARGNRSFPAERLEEMARSTFDRADRDGNGFLDRQERTTVGPASLRDDFEKSGVGEVSFAEFRKALAARLGVALPKQTKVEPKHDQTKAKKPTRDPRYAAYFTKLLAKYDGDSDGKLNVDEWSKMSKDPGDADVDGDGFITVEELTVWSMKK